MNPREITDADMRYWSPLSPRAATYAADDPTFEPCPAIITDDTHGSRVGGGIIVRVPLVLDEIEIVKLAKGGTIWLGTFGGLPPFTVHVQGPDDAQVPLEDVP